jgi:molecular chaperone HtpG
MLRPRYLRYVRGVIDRIDLPLNVSGEILQPNRAIDSMRSASVRKVLGLLEELVQDGRYKDFWDQFGRVLKEGLIEDPENRERIAGLLRFASTADDQPTPTVSLDDYIGRMKSGQKAIYCLVADSHPTAVSSPHLEVFRKRGIEVLLLSDPIDEWVTMHLTRYKEHDLKSVARGALDLGDVAD